MKAIAILGLSAAVLAWVVSVQACDSTSCVGPVRASFDTSDCTGTPVFMELGLDNIGSCSSQQLNLVLEDRATTTSFDTINCDPTQSFETESFFFGICFVSPLIYETRTSNMYLANASAPYEAPQIAFEFDDTVTYSSDRWDECDSADNCLLSDGSPALYYQNVYEQTNCGTFDYSEFMSRLQPGTCSRYFNNSYAKTSCISAESYQIAFFALPDCSGPAFETNLFFVTCGPNSQIQGHCSGTFEPIYDGFIPTPSEAPQTEPNAESPNLPYEPSTPSFEPHQNSSPHTEPTSSSEPNHGTSPQTEPTVSAPNQVAEPTASGEPNQNASPHIEPTASSEPNETSSPQTEPNAQPQNPSPSEPNQNESPDAPTSKASHIMPSLAILIFALASFL